MEKVKMEHLLYFSILILLKFTLIQSDCLVMYPDNVEISPIYKKIFGKYSVELPYDNKEIQINDGDIIQAICRTNFSSVSYYTEDRNDYYYNRQRSVLLNNQTSIRLQCQNNRLYFNNSILQEKILKCNQLRWSIYDATETYEWCEKNDNVTTFLLAVKSNEDHHILAGICYNLKEWSLQAITYNVTNSRQKYNIEMQRDITKTDLKSFQSLGDDLYNLKTTKTFDLTENDLQQQLINMSKTNSWLHLANYEMSSIVQGDSYENYFSEYINILNTIWWRNLRLGNWKLFMETLENYAHNNSFQLYTGKSGVVQIPTQNIENHYTLEIKNGYQNETVPAYIWTYLTSTDNQNDDFIIVGYNSPFAEFFTLDKVVFCPSICSEIPWLKDIQSSFHFSTAGIMFCCSPEFIKQTNYLNGFPMDILMSRFNEKQTNIAADYENSTQNLLKENEEETTTVLNQFMDDDIELKTESSLIENVTNNLDKEDKVI